MGIGNGRPHPSAPGHEVTFAFAANGYPGAARVPDQTYMVPTHRPRPGSELCRPSVDLTRQRELGHIQKARNPLILLARPTRFERVTYGLEGRCSIQLS
ncbi:hypothetical protein EMIT0111MI5_100227 [Burkholderia sp. IT-111MI5]